MFEQVTKFVLEDDDFLILKHVTELYWFGGVETEVQDKNEEIGFISVTHRLHVQHWEAPCESSLQQ